MFKFDDFKIVNLEKITSTNDYAKELISLGNKENLLILANSQTRGKTTKANSYWESPKGNLYLTIAIKIDRKIERFLHFFSFLTALSIVESVNSVKPNSNIKIKWPNDVLLNVKKLSGILIEKEEDFAIIGIGVNITSSPHKSYVKYPTTSLKEEGIDIELDDFFKILIERFIKNINFAIDTDFTKIIDKIKPYMYKINETIYIDFNNQVISGEFEGLDANGGIIIKTDKEKKILLSGELTKENFT